MKMVAPWLDLLLILSMAFETIIRPQRSITICLCDLLINNRAKIMAKEKYSYGVNFLCGKKLR